jgi:thymidylate kinase
MIIFINGAFGSGKTTLANLLVERLPNALLYDPEEVGAMLRHILAPIDNPSDFQDYPLWRGLVPEVAKGLLSYSRTLVMPMTVWRENYFQEIVGQIKQFEPDFIHFCLMASLEVVNERIRKRGHQPEGDWVFDQTPKCVAAFESAAFECKIDTTNLSPQAIADKVLRFMNA